jgi:hypothetical protein
MSKKPRRLRTIGGGRATSVEPLILEVRAIDDPTTAMRASVKALSGPQGRAEGSGRLRARIAGRTAPASAPGHPQGMPPSPWLPSRASWGGQTSP